MFDCDHNYCKNVRCEDCIDITGVGHWTALDHCCQRCIEFHCRDCGDFHIVPKVDSDNLKCSLFFPWATTPAVSEEEWHILEKLGRGIGIYPPVENESDLDYYSDRSDFDIMANVCEEYYWTD